MRRENRKYKKIRRKTPSQEPRALFRSGHAARTALAKPPVSVSGDPPVHEIAKGARHNPRHSTEDSPDAAEPTSEKQDRGALGEYHSLRSDHVDGCWCFRDVVGVEQRSDVLVLERTKTQHTLPIVSDQNINGGVAEIADTVEDHDGGKGRQATSDKLQATSRRSHVLGWRAHYEA